MPPAPSVRHCAHPRCCFLPTLPPNQVSSVNLCLSQARPPAAIACFVSPALQPDLVGAVTLDLLNMVFSAFGLVKKLVLLNKPEGGAVAWVQVPDAVTAVQVGQHVLAQGQVVCNRWG